MTEHKPHWAACRKPDIQHAGRKIWRRPHDSSERVLLCYWYSEAGPLGGDDFDVRHLPGYTEFPRFEGAGGANWLHRYARHADQEQEHHFKIIREAIDARVDMLAISNTAVEAQEQERFKRTLSLSTDIDEDAPF